MKLIPMIDFVLEQGMKSKKVDDIGYDSDLFKEICSYAEFLKQPLKLEMFVPCDEDENVLEEKFVENYKTDFGLYSDFENYNRKYYKAKEKVLFKNYELQKEDNYYIVIDSHGRYAWLSWNNSKTIESLINEITEVSLTDNAIKLITK